MRQTEIHTERQIGDRIMTHRQKQRKRQTETKKQKQDIIMKDRWTERDRNDI